MKVVVSDINQDRLDETVKAVQALGAEAIGVVTDVTQPPAMEALADAAYGRFGVVNVLCLNAGAAVIKPFEQLTREDWDKVLGVQFGGVLNGVLTFLPRLIAQGGEVVIEDGGGAAIGRL